MKSVSIIIATYNSGKIIDECLKSIEMQDYPKECIEVIIMDGGSLDGTIEIAKRYGVRIIPENTGSPESAKAIGLNYAKNELIADFGSDNIIPDKAWLKRMTELFEKEPEITGAYTWRYTYRRDDNCLNRYFALFGVNDPVPYYLKKADRQSWIEERWELSGNAEDKGDYFLVKFSLGNMPTLGANGFLIKKEILKQAECSREMYFHIDVIWDVINKGYNTFAVSKNHIIHKTGGKIFNYFMKRKRYMEELYLRDSSKRRYKIYNKNNIKALMKYIIFSMTLIEPIYQSIKGYIKIRDIAWFLHPIVCFFTVILYGYVIVKWKMKQLVAI